MPNQALVRSTTSINLSVFGGTEVRSGARAVTYGVANALAEPHLFMQPGVKPANAGQLSRLASCRPAAVGVVAHTLRFVPIFC